MTRCPVNEWPAGWVVIIDGDGCDEEDDDEKLEDESEVVGRDRWRRRCRLSGNGGTTIDMVSSSSQAS